MKNLCLYARGIYRWAVLFKKHPEVRQTRAKQSSHPPAPSLHSSHPPIIPDPHLSLSVPTVETKVSPQSPESRDQLIGPRRSQPKISASGFFCFRCRLNCASRNCPAAVSARLRTGVTPMQSQIRTTIAKTTHGFLGRWIAIPTEELLVEVVLHGASDGRL